MGLFSNNKKPCPICGSATPRLLPDTVEGMPICKECAKKKDLPGHVWDSMTVDGFRQYLAFHQENQALRDRFRQTRNWRNLIFVDAPDRLFKLESRSEALVMEGACIRSFRLLEGNNVLYESGPNGLICHETDIPARVQAAAPLVMQFRMQRDQFQHMERMRDSMRREGGGREPSPPPPYVSEPLFHYPIVQKGFTFEITLDHPYWSGTHSWLAMAPEFDDTFPSVENLLHDLDREVQAMYDLAMDLMGLMGAGAVPVQAAPGAPVQNGGAAQAAPAVDTVTELQRYKVLLDSGVITEEEFTAKKRQLLGI